MQDIITIKRKLHLKAASLKFIAMELAFFQHRNNRKSPINIIFEHYEAYILVYHAHLSAYRATDSSPRLQSIVRRASAMPYNT